MSYSVVEARAQLPKLLREAEQGKAVEITRRGAPVAVVVGVEEYRRMSAGKRSFREVYEAFRQKHPLEGLDLGGDPFGDLRDPAPGREVEL